MVKTFAFAAVAIATFAATSPVLAEDIEFPADRPNIVIKRSYRTGEAVVIPPYRHLFPVRVFTTPQRDPYYNVPPYAVVSPY